MRCVRLAIVLSLAMAAMVVAVGNASAAAVTTVAPWRTGTTESGTTVLTGSQAVFYKIGSEPLVISGSVGGVPLESTATGIKCVECTIFNEAGGAKGKGKLVLTGVVVKSPATCAINHGEIRSNTLKIDSTYMIGTGAYTQYAPESSETFAVFEIVKGTGNCAIAGSYAVKGSLFSKGVNPTGSYKTSHESKFSPAITAEAGGGLILGSKSFNVTGSYVESAGGKFFGVE